ncbi:MAG: NfeD family protein [Kiritimatiellae bacterium]|nr:NfeD family protein [Kiritimatiellia bacterium]
MMKNIPVLWFLVGVGLAFLELATPGFVILFFGLAAITVSLVVWLCPALSFTWQLGIFMILTIGYIVFLRSWLKNMLVGKTSNEGGDPDSEVIGQQTTVVEAIPANGEGKVEVFGTNWRAVAATPLSVGTRVRVAAQNNLVLTVEPL